MLNHPLQHLALQSQSPVVGPGLRRDDGGGDIASEADRKICKSIQP